MKGKKGNFFWGYFKGYSKGRKQCRIDKVGACTAGSIEAAAGYEVTPLGARLRRRIRRTVYITMKLSLRYSFVSLSLSSLSLAFMPTKTRIISLHYTNYLARGDHVNFFRRKRREKRQRRLLSRAMQPVRESSSP